MKKEKDFYDYQGGGGSKPRRKEHPLPRDTMVPRKASAPTFLQPHEEGRWPLHDRDEEGEVFFFCFKTTGVYFRGNGIQEL